MSCSIGVLDPLLCSSAEQPVFTGEEAAQAVLDVFMELSKELRQLKDLPLAINSLQGTSPVFRHTEVVRLSVCVSLALESDHELLTHCRYFHLCPGMANFPPSCKPHPLKTANQIAYIRHMTFPRLPMSQLWKVTAKRIS